MMLTAQVVSLYAQELVPAAYTPAPYGINLLTFATHYSNCDVTIYPSLPI